MMAACAGKMAVVRYLLSPGADPTARDGDGNDAIAWAEQGQGNSEVVAVLTEAVKAPVGMLIMAACRGDEARVDELLRLFPELNVNAVQDGHTALMLAVFWGKAGVVRKLLVEYKADPNVSWTEGNRSTCLMRAAGNGDEEVVRLLLEHGANVYAKDASGRTTVNRALVSLDVVAVPCLELLKAHGADLTAANHEGATALRKAASEGQMEFVRYLLAHGADPLARDKQGRDAIACAKATSEGREVVGVLTKAANEHMERLAAQIEGQANGQAQVHKDKKRKRKHRHKTGKGRGAAGIWDAPAGGSGGGGEVTVDAVAAGGEGGGNGDEEQQLQQVTAAVEVASLHGGGAEPAPEGAEAQDTATAVAALPADTNEIEEEAPPVELTEEDFDDAPTLFECPISHTIMCDPVTSQDGYSYERSHIETWIRKAAEEDVELRSPMTNDAMEPVLNRNLVLKFMVDEYMQRKLTEKKARLATVAANP